MALYSAVSDTRNIEASQTHPKFHFRNDQSTILSILLEKLAAAVCCKGALFRHKIGTKFIKAAYRRSHFI